MYDADFGLMKQKKTANNEFHPNQWAVFRLRNGEKTVQMSLFICESNDHNKGYGYGMFSLGVGGSIETFFQP